MPRPLWSGSISFGLVNVPVRMYSAVREHKLHFHFVHEKDSSPIGYQKVCKAEGKPVPDDEVVKAFEYTKGKYVFMDDEDFEQAQVEGYKAIDVTDFVPAEEIDPIYFADEIQPIDEIKPSKQRIGKEELAMARQLVESGTTTWKPERYKDTYQDELKAAIEAKRKGKEVHRAAEVDEGEEPIDLMEALRASVQQAKGRRAQRRPARKRTARGKKRAA